MVQVQRRILVCLAAIAVCCLSIDGYAAPRVRPVLRNAVRAAATNGLLQFDKVRREAQAQVPAMPPTKPKSKNYEELFSVPKLNLGNQEFEFSNPLKKELDRIDQFIEVLKRPTLWDVMRETDNDSITDKFHRICNEQYPADMYFKKSEAWKTIEERIEMIDTVKRPEIILPGYSNPLISY